MKSFRYIIRIRQNGNSLEHTATDSALDAEKAYLALCLTPRPGLAGTLASENPERVSPGVFSQAEPWAVIEENTARKSLWAFQADDYKAPGPTLLRAAVELLGQRNETVARKLGISPRLFRSWISNTAAAEQKRIDFTSWFVLRCWLARALRNENHCKSPFEIHQNETA
jgi:hypothetical protein